MHDVIGYAVIAIFVVSLLFIWKYEHSIEGKDERGERILNLSYKLAYGSIFVGFFIVEFIAKEAFGITDSSLLYTAFKLVLIGPQRKVLYHRPSRTLPDRQTV